MASLNKQMKSPKCANGPNDFDLSVVQHQHGPQAWRFGHFYGQILV